MNILFLTLVNINNINERNIYSDLMREFIKKEHNVFIVSPIERKQNQNTKLFEEQNFHLLKVKIGNITKTNILEKGISTLNVSNIFYQNIRKYFNKIKFDLIIYSTPPITFNKVIKKIKKRDNSKTYLLLKDIFPQNAVDLKMFSNKSFVYWYFRQVEKKLYNMSDYIGCMSQANVDFLKENNNYLDFNKLEICPNSIEYYPINNSINEKEELKNKYNIPKNKILFIYGGNIGKPQGITYIIDCIKENENRKNTFFIIVGSGTEYNKLYKYLKNDNIKNTILISYLQKDEFEKLVNICDVGMIFLDYRFTIPNFPSRLLSYMQAGLPVLAATDNKTDIGEIIVSNNLGYWVESKKINEFYKYVDYLCDKEVRVAQGQNSKKYLLNNYTVEKSYNVIMNHFIKKVENGNAK